MWTKVNDSPTAAEPARQVSDAERLISAAAHDLRNPIAVMRASAQMAARQVLRGDAESAQRRLDAIVAQTERATALLERFVDAAQVQANNMPLRREPVRLSELVQEAVARARTMTGERGGREVELSLADGCAGDWDRARVGRAVYALVENAFLYGQAEAPVRIETACGGGMARLVISGGGEGPVSGERDRLFEPYFRGHAAAEAGQSGSGLGLFTARGIARAHGGEVRLADGGPPDAFGLDLPLAA